MPHEAVAHNPQFRMVRFRLAVLDEPRDIPWISLNPCERGQVMDNVDVDSAAYSNCYGSRRRYVEIVILRGRFNINGGLG